MGVENNNKSILEAATSTQSRINENNNNNNKCKSPDPTTRLVSCQDQLSTRTNDSEDNNCQSLPNDRITDSSLISKNESKKVVKLNGKRDVDSRSKQQERQASNAAIENADTNSIITNNKQNHQQATLITNQSNNTKFPPPSNLIGASPAPHQNQVVGGKTTTSEQSIIKAKLDRSHLEASSFGGHDDKFEPPVGAQLESDPATASTTKKVNKQAGGGGGEEEKEARDKLINQRRKLSLAAMLEQQAASNKQLDSVARGATSTSSSASSSPPSSKVNSTTKLNQQAANFSNPDSSRSKNPHEDGTVLTAVIVEEPAKKGDASFESIAGGEQKTCHSLPIGSLVHIDSNNCNLDPIAHKKLTQQNIAFKLNQAPIKSKEDKENLEEQRNSPQTTSRANQQEQQFFCRRKQLTYLQTLLLRKWPCFALSICIMSSLVLALSLSALTVLLMHGYSADCSAAYKLISSHRGPLTAQYENRMLMLESSAHELGQQAQLSASLESSASSSSFPQTLLASTPNALASAQSGSSFRRLSESVWPYHYDLFIWPRIAEPFNFTGKVTIHIKCKQETSNITFHSRNLQLNEATLSLSSIPHDESKQPGQLDVPKIKALEYDRELQHSIVQLNGSLTANRSYALAIDFEGVLADDLAGFYRIRYEQANSTEPTWIAATQFQATEARKAFPCFDEPLFKATFSISIRHWKNMSAISNMPLVSSQKEEDSLWVTDKFAKTRTMSTYLVAFAVTNFESRSDGDITVWTRPGLIHTADYALGITGKILRHYESFFGLKYPLPKMDMIALPDFNAGAMENWGLITYRETAMLFDEKKTSLINKQRIATVVAHELAHQWFGNLVTPKWWDDLWLNEGFASFVEYLGVDHIEPGWKMLDQFNAEELQVALRLDSLSNSHPISVPVRSPEEINEIFDAISYQKGACVIRMMFNFLTEPVMKRGLHEYLKDRMYDNAEQADLWAHLKAAQNGQQAQQQTADPNHILEPIDVAKVMNSWTLQTGYPLVTLKRRYDGTRSATIEQHRYQSHRPMSANANNNTSIMPADSTRWEVPITATSESEQNWVAKTKFWLHQSDQGPQQAPSHLLPQSDQEWVVLNVNQVGYYRVNYDERNWHLLVSQLKRDHSKISPSNRAQIMTDLMELARSGVLSYHWPMEATKYLAQEEDFLPWDSSLFEFDYIDNMLQRTSMYGDWTDYLASVLEPLIARYRGKPWTLMNNNNTLKDDLIGAHKQAAAVIWACQLGDKLCIEQAKGLFRDWRFKGINEIDPVLRSAAYCSAIEHGTKEDWDFLWERYLKEDSATERDRIMKALCCTKEPWLLIRYLDLAFSNSKNVRRQDGPSVIRGVAKNNYGREIAFHFVRENWPQLREFYGRSSFAFGNMIRSLSSSMNTQSELDQVLHFYEQIKSDLGTGKRMFQITIEEIESNVAWRKRNFKFFETWLKENKATRLSGSAIKRH